MAEYRLVVNSAYDAKEAAMRQNWNPGYPITIPGAPTIETQVLDVRVTQEDWERLKRAVLEGAK